MSKKTNKKTSAAISTTSSAVTVTGLDQQEQREEHDGSTQSKKRPSVPVVSCPWYHHISVVFLLGVMLFLLWQLSCLDRELKQVALYNGNLQTDLSQALTVQQNLSSTLEVYRQELENIKTALQISSETTDKKGETPSTDSKQ